jgi:hypothetical protein
MIYRNPAMDPGLVNRRANSRVYIPSGFTARGSPGERDSATVSEEAGHHESHAALRNPGRRRSCLIRSRKRRRSVSRAFPSGPGHPATACIKVTATIPVGTEPYAVAANPRTNIIYVANEVGNTV